VNFTRLSSFSKGGRKLFAGIVGKILDTVVTGLLQPLFNDAKGLESVPAKETDKNFNPLKLRTISGPVVATLSLDTPPIEEDIGRDAQGRFRVCAQPADPSHDASYRSSPAIGN
jgi:hypothetical protein